MLLIDGPPGLDQDLPAVIVDIFLDLVDAVGFGDDMAGGKAGLLDLDHALGDQGNDGTLPDALAAAALEGGDGAAADGPVAALGGDEEERVQDAHLHGEGGGFVVERGGLPEAERVGEILDAGDDVVELDEEGVEGGLGGAVDARLEQDEGDFDLHAQAQQRLHVVRPEDEVVGVVLEEGLDGREPGFEGGDGFVAAGEPVGRYVGRFPVPVDAQVGFDELVDRDQEVVELQLDLGEGHESWRYRWKTDGEGFGSRFGERACLDVVAGEDAEKDIKFISRDGSEFRHGRRGLR